MAKKKYDIVWYLGRFQGFHTAHAGNLDICLDLGTEVIMMLGSANLAPSPENPWSAAEREVMIRASMLARGKRNSLDRVSFRHINDSYYNWDKFLDAVRGTVDEFAMKNFSVPASELNVAMVGPKKDEKTAEYVDLLKADYDYVELPIVEGLSASELRDQMYKLDAGTLPHSAVFPEADSGVRKFMFDFSQTPEFTRLKKQYKYENGYLPERKGTALYPINDCAADALVTTASGHILLMKRKGKIGYGQWAIPGGHLETTETFLQGALRELREEVKIDCPEKVLLGSLVDKEVFDYPYRERHTRILTQAFHFKLKDTKPPKVLVNDPNEVIEVKWFTWTEVKRMKLFSDHGQIIEYFLG